MRVLLPLGEQDATVRLGRITAGPREQLSLGGATLRHAWPLSVIAGNVRLAVAAFSYAGELHVTVIADADSCPDVDVFADAVRSVLTSVPVEA